MADSVDRVFVHALNTLKKIPKTGASRPPPSDRLRLYGLYKQAMEGDVDGVMEQPGSGPGLAADELQRERDKWHAWNAQKGLSRTEAKRRYVEALIETMHRYATTSDATELVAELEFVWNQIKHNAASSASSSPQAGGGGAAAPRHLPLKVLSPMSERDEAELRSQQRQTTERDDDDDDDDDDDEDDDDDDAAARRRRRQDRVERAVTKLAAEVAALREHMSRGREWRGRRERSWPARLGWMAWLVARHVVVDGALLLLALLWMRRRRDGRLERLVRAAVAAARGYAARALPSR